MASNIDDFVVDFDLNHLQSTATAVEDNVQASTPKYEKIRKSVSWLKSRIISTDFAIQKFQSIKEDLEQSLKAHSVTRKELQQVCINYKDASEKCLNLENENKTLIANHQELKVKVTDAENKYDALLSHANQLQMLVKKLEIEKDALTVEKELNRCSNKDDVTVLQREKDAMLNDFIALKDIILGKRKTSKKHVNILKKYVRGVKYKEPKILCTSEESGDDLEKYCDTTLNKVHNDPDKQLMSRVEQNFIDNCSDGRVSVDTGRGSSRANSHEKYLSSPDYVVTLEALLKPRKDVVQVDAANSPITIYPPRSTATSPVVFDDSTHVYEDHYDNYECVDGAEYTIDDVPISEEIDHLVEQEKLADCPSPVPDMSKFDTEIRPIGNYKYIVIKEADIMPSNKSIFDPIEPDETSDCDREPIIVEEIPRCMCNKSDTFILNDKKMLIDACTSPLQTPHDLRKFVDIGISTDERDESVNIHKSTVTIGTNTANELECENQISMECERNATNNIKLSEKKLVDASTNTNSVPLENREVIDIEISVPTKKQNEKLKKSQVTDQEKLPATDEQTSRCLDNKRSSKSSKNRLIPSEDSRTQEIVCLESNSSKKLHFERSNDVEVQNILNVMKLRHDLVSPMAKSPSDYEYLKLIPEMNCTLAKILSTVQNIYKMPNTVRNYDTNSRNSNEIINFEESSETEIFNSLRNSDQKRPGTVITLNQVTEDNVIDTSRTNMETSSTSTDNTCSEEPMPITKKVNLTKTKYSDLFDDTLLPHYINDKILGAEGNKINPQHEQVAISTINSEDNVDNTKKTDHNTLVAEDNNKEKDSEEPNYSEINNTEISNTSEVRTPHTIIINGTKSKKKSKLDKFREKLLPTCKIKKVTPPIIKHAPKTYGKPKNTVTSPSLNQKLAYENAVKVMAELRSNQELQEKKKQVKSETKDLENKSSKIKSVSETVEQNMLFTRSRTRRLSKKEEDTTITAEYIKDIEKSPVKRKLRKRSADTQGDSSLSKFKRILRSSNVTRVNTEKVLSEDDNIADQLLKDIENNTECKETIKSTSYLDNSLSKCSKSMNDEGNNLNPETNHVSPQNEHTAAEDCNIFEKSTRSTKPVIELSKCLADNANVVSIIPGNVGYLDVNKNISHRKKSVESNRHLLGNQNNQQHLEKRNGDIIMENLVESPNTDQCIKLTNKCQDIVSAGSMESTSSSSTIGNVYSNNARGDYRSEQKSPRKTDHLHVQHNGITNIGQNITNSLEDKLREHASIGMIHPVVQIIPLGNDVIACKKNIVSYSDLDIYTEGSTNTAKGIPNTPPTYNQRRNDNILCTALDRYGVISVKYVAKKVPDSVTHKICQKIEQSIPKIIASPEIEQKSKMDELVHSIETFETKQILAGLMKYLKDPTRKNELFNKIISGPAPPMTKSEVILLYVIQCLNESTTPDFINRLWNNIEHALFQLNRAPEFDVIESMSHFYAVLCRYFRNKSRLRCFMLDAMYCLQFKAIPLIRQCLEVCSGVLPNAHELMAKTSLVTCLVYLLHFYKCQDKFNRAQDIRNILSRQYKYRFSEWNETMILEIFRKAIMDLRETHNGKKMLRVALIILCKRHGAKWCQLNIIQNMLLPIIEKKDVPDRIKQFCVLMLGPLLKPFPADRKAQCEIVINQLLQMLKQGPSQEMKEAIYSSLIFMNKHDQDRVVQSLLSWNPEKVSPEFEDILNDYVMEKPLAMWKKIVAKKPSQCS